ncbi:hypothetical protein [Aestuariibaculum sediminum]|uniref:Uncharacterized protein n=1 Tax=Aestuariibaculum sediminum TaxID=2770637 RepID=A0A8J6UHQ0_9FLAO|nr:hypothetical protein [Aestuariibaculum sediminum]MBD0833191.1 hypothetical protein [Aestuariibaculum sediminum]
MKNLLLVFTLLSIISCKKENSKSYQNFIEPCRYNVISYQVKDTSFFKIVGNVMQNKNTHVQVKGDSTFVVSEELGELIFNGSDFNYKIEKDSLFLYDGKVSLSYKILDIYANAISIQIDNNPYLNRIDFVKPKDQRRKVAEEIKIEF